MTEDERAAIREAFADQVRTMYTEMFGEEAFKGTDQSEPVNLGPILVLVEAQYLDGESGLITLYSGSYNTCKGMAWRFLDDDYRDDE